MTGFKPQAWLIENLKKNELLGFTLALTLAKSHCKAWFQLMILNSSEAIDHWSMVSVCFKHQDKLHPNPCGLDSLPRNKASICPLVFIPYRSSEQSQMLGFLGVELVTFA